MNTTGLLDPLLRKGLTVTVANLVAVFTAHRPADQAACPACGHRYTTAAPNCPSATLARALLKRRRGEDPNAFELIRAELRAADTRTLPDPEPAAPTPATGHLFPIDPAWRIQPRRPGRPAAGPSTVEAP